MTKNYPNKKTVNKKWTPPVIEMRPRFIPPNGWLKQFEDVFNFALNETGHGAINAVAGSGKTTALVELVYRYKEKFPTHKILAIAFNSSIRKELQSRLVGADIHTCHSFGYKSVIKVWGKGKANFDLQGPKGFVVQKLAENAIGLDKDKADDRDSLCHAVSLSKTRLASNLDDVMDVMAQWSIDTTYPKEVFAKHVLDIMDHMKTHPGSGGDGKMAITFDDQVWLPIVNGWTPHDQYDLVVVDEAQDLSPARTEIARRALKPDGRMIVVGDKFQAIYSFAGADIHALPDITKELNAKEMPLTCSFRCSKSVVREAQQYNPGIESAPSAPEGTVTTIATNDLIKTVKPGDAIISRTNAPLVKVFFRLAKNGTKVRMMGRDFAASIGQRVSSWQKKAKKASQKFTGEDLIEKNGEWLEEQIKYLKKKKLTTDRAEDEHDTINSLCEDLSVKLSSELAVKEVLERINTIFSADEEPGGNDGVNCVTLSSTHKFKGLERNRIFALWDTYRPFNNEEETHLAYVCVTRAKSDLFYVKGKFTE